VPTCGVSGRLYIVRSRCCRPSCTPNVTQTDRQRQLRNSRRQFAVRLTSLHTTRRVQRVSCCSHAVAGCTLLDVWVHQIRADTRACETVQIGQFYSLPCAQSRTANNRRGRNFTPFSCIAQIYIYTGPILHKLVLSFLTILIFFIIAIVSTVIIKNGPSYVTLSMNCCEPY
jgi:hypothetical protein